MNTLPPELHSYICELACYGVGANIRALNGVCRYFYEVSKPYLYHNVAVSNGAQISALLLQLESIPSRLRHIRHLYLCDAQSPTITSAPTSRTHSGAPKDVGDLTRNTMRIITFAASTLESFAFVSQSQSSSTLIARIFRISFPHLRRLTISGFYPFPSSPGKFPCLEYLHLVGNRNPAGLLQMSTLDDACPSLKKLQISGLNLAGSFVIEAIEAVEASEKVDKDENISSTLMPARLPPKVKEVILQAGPAPTSGRWDMAAMKDRVMMAQLDSLKTKIAMDRRGLEVTVLERGMQPISAVDIRGEWLEKIC